MKDGMMYPVFKKSAANCRIGSEAVANEISTCPVAVPTQSFWVLVSEGPCGAIGVMQSWVAPYLTTPVSRCGRYCQATIVVFDGRVDI